MVFNDRIADYSLWKSFLFIPLSMVASVVIAIPLMGIASVVGFQYLKGQGSEITDEIHRYLPNHEDATGEVCNVLARSLSGICYSTVLCLLQFATHLLQMCPRQFNCDRRWSNGP